EDQLASRTDPMTLGRAWTGEGERTRRQGLRGLRLSLARPELFQVQLRAVLRASQHGRVRGMFPFVSSVGQIREAKRMLAEAEADRGGGGEGVGTVRVGGVVEFRAAAFRADLLARGVVFLTIGPNDLIQYCLAVDRAGPRVSRLYEPLHPAVLRLILT